MRLSILGLLAALAVPAHAATAPPPMTAPRLLAGI